MKNLHLLPDTFFSKPYIDLINNHFQADDHRFMVFKLNRDKPQDYPNHSNVISIKYPRELTALFSECRKADNIFLHGLSSHKIIRYLFFHQQIARKCHWLIWGADLYYYRIPKRGVYDILFEQMRRRVIRKFRSIISYTPADIKLVKDIYRIKGDVNKCFFYPGVLMLKEMPDELFFIEQKDKIRIILGNSSTPDNNHSFILEQLTHHPKERFKIICPLSYGDNEYGTRIKELGQLLFGENFIAITELMPMTEYTKLLNSIDIGIFDYNRQQGVGNILLLLQLGKKIFIRQDSPISDLLDSYNIKYFTTNTLGETLFNPLDINDVLKNRSIVEGNFGEKSSLKSWNEIFTKYDPD